MPVLDNLRSDSIAQLPAVVGTTNSLRQALRRQPEVLRAQKALAQGALTFSEIQEFVENCLAHFHRGEHWPFDPAISALAVILESIPGEFPQSFLEDLAKIKASEMPRSPRIARQCLNERQLHLTRITQRGVILQPPQGEESQVLNLGYPSLTNSGYQYERQLHLTRITQGRVILQPPQGEESQVLNLGYPSLTNSGYQYEVPV